MSTAPFPRGLPPVKPSATEVSTGSSIGARFAAIAELGSDRLAFRGPNIELTYQELNARANRLAHRLIACSVPRDQPCAILADGGLHQVVAVLAALKAGRVCLVIDPANPPERVAAIVQHAGAGILVTDGANGARAAARNPRPHHVIRVDAELSQEPTNNPCVRVDPEAPALILYTSGSTGRPKGVVHTHRSIFSNFMRHADAFRIAQDDRQTLLYQLSVYGGTRDLFNALLSGASLHYFPVREVGATGLAAWLMAERITIYCSVASVFREFSVTVPAPLIFPDLRLVKIGGEATHAVDVVRFRGHLPPHSLIQCHLSSTETGLICNYPLRPGTELADETIPLGYPAEGSEVLLADDLGEPVQPGATGEIWVRGPSLAWGYWRDDAATASAFEESSNAGARTYRTGDLAVRRADGCLEHRGRTDFQVKIRGNRVDLTEIERHLLEHAACRQVAVMARPGANSAPRLVAYVECEKGACPSVPVLRAFLAERVPPYMIPSVFVLLDALPRTGNGKIDRAALPDPGPERPGLSTPYVAPSNAMEAELCALWRELLGVDPVGAADDFFDLGGHSLLAAQIIAWIDDAHGVPLSVRDLFANPTVAGLSLVVQKLKTNARIDRAPALAPVDRRAFHAHSPEIDVPTTKKDFDV